MRPLRTETDTTGFPEVYAIRVGQIRRSQARFRGFLLLVAAASGVLGWGAIFRDWSIGLATAATVLLVYALIVQVADLFSAPPHKLARIVPYFEAKVPGPDTFVNGYALARHCRYLDALALNEDLDPISTFGFADSLRGEDARWHAPDQGLEAVEALLERLRRSPTLVPEPEAVVEDLERLRHKLQEASRLGVRFCLHLRMDWAYSPQEFDIRTGRY